MYYIIIIALLLVIFSTRITNYRVIQSNIIKKRRGEKRVMPKEFLKSFVGKEVIVSLFNETFAVQGELLEIEENWIKVETKKETMIINGDMIRDISVKKEAKKK